MAMLHHSDLNFAISDPVSLPSIVSLFQDRLQLVPKEIISHASSQGDYHKIYLVSLPEGQGRWSGKDVVLRVARKAFTRIKTENEVAIIELVRKAGIPAPEILFFDSNADAEDNKLGYEYMCMERIPYSSLSETWMTIPSEALDRVLDQLVDLFIKMYELDLPSGHFYGGLRKGEAGQILPGPVLEETMWQLPDIARYFTSPPYLLISETFTTLNPTGPYETWPAYISAFMKTYHHIISIHPSVSFLSHLLIPLQRLICKLDADDDVEPWIMRLRREKGLQGKLWHRDLHFGNILADEMGVITGVIDWEFSGIGPSFHSRSSPVQNCVSYLSWIHKNSSVSAVPTPDIITTWPPEFLSRLSRRSPSIHSSWVHESDPARVLGQEGQALSDVREYLRSCLEVGVRGWGNLDAAKGKWREAVESKLSVLVRL